MQFPGPNDEGLALMRYTMTMFPRLGKVWYGPVNPAVGVWHPDTVRAIMKTSGTTKSYKCKKERSTSYKVEISLVSYHLNSMLMIAS